MPCLPQDLQVQGASETSSEVRMWNGTPIPLSALFASRQTQVGPEDAHSSPPLVTTGTPRRIRFKETIQILNRARSF